MQTLEQKIDQLSRQVKDLSEIISAELNPQNKFCLSVEELAQRWDVSVERIRRLVRDKKLKPMRGLGKHRFTLDEIRRFENADQEVDKLALLRSRHLGK
jgi:DNA-binding transcriptional regulator YhcF (GntR family)